MLIQYLERMQLVYVLSLMLSLAACLPSGTPVETHEAVHEDLPGRQPWLELAQFHFKDWELWDIALLCKRETIQKLYTCEYTFHWFDPNYNESTDCNNHFQWDGVTLEQGPNNSYNTNYVMCSTPVNVAEYWDNKFDDVTSLWAYGMTVSRIRRDMIIGAGLTHYFGYPNITMKMMGETENQKSYVSTINPVMVKITGLSL